MQMHWMILFQFVFLEIIVQENQHLLILWLVMKFFQVEEIRSQQKYIKFRYLIPKILQELNLSIEMKKLNYYMKEILLGSEKEKMMIKCFRNFHN